MAVNINVPSQVKTFANLAAFPATGALKTIYIAEDTNKTYRWTGSVYVEVSASASGITIGSTAIASGVVGRVLFEGAGNVLQQSSSLFWDNTNNRLGIGTDTPAHTFQVYRNTSAGYLASFNSGATLNTNASLTIRIENANLPSIQALSPGAGGFNTFAINPLGGNLLIGTTTDAGFKLDVNGTARVQGNAQFGTGFYWDNTNGRLGIGTSTPAFPLDILGSSSIIGVKLRNSLSSGYTEINLFNNSGGNNDRMYMGVGGTTTGDAFQNRGYFFSGSNLEGINFTANKTTTGDIRFFTGGVNERLRIHGNGNILINTTTDAGFRLDVNGTARFQSDVTVANSLMKIYVTGGAIRFEQQAGAGIPIGFMQNGSFYQYIDQATLNIAFRNDYSFVMTTGNTSTINTSAKMQIDSTTKGFLAPRMTTTQKNAIATPATGLQVYDTTLNRPCFYDGTTWITL